jgi:hypothetical protein
VVTRVRPALLFADRLDHLLKALFALSIIGSGLSASFVGFIKLSDLLEVLIFSWPGRVAMVVIGTGSLLTSLWKLLEVKQVSR